LRRYAQLVAQRQSDAPFAQIERQYPAVYHEDLKKPVLARFAVARDFISS
jgi:hypothetical protein